MGSDQQPVHIVMALLAERICRVGDISLPSHPTSYPASIHSHPPSNDEFTTSTLEILFTLKSRETLAIFRVVSGRDASALGQVR